MRFLVGLLTATMALAGCADADSFVPAEADPCVVQSADDFSCDEIPVGDPDDVAHIHDYWQGQERMTILEFSQPADPSSGGLITSCEGWPEHRFHAEDGFSVIQGTQYVEVTMDWGDEPYDRFSDPELWIKTASMQEPEFVQTITPGETVVFESTNADNDLPHSLLSSWEFIWYAHPEANDPMCDISHRSEISIRVDIEKGLDIPVFSAHPDRWDGGNITDITIMEDHKDVDLYWGDEENEGACLSNDCFWDQTAWRFFEGALVPYDTETVIFELDVAAESPSQTLGFRYHGSDTREMTTLQPTSTDGSKQIYEIDIERIQADGPYALQTLWDVDVFPTNDDGTFSGSVGLTITVHKDAD